MKISKFIKKFVTFSVLLSLCVQFLQVTQGNALVYIHKKINVDFEETEENTEGFVNTCDALGASHISSGSRMKVVGDELSLSGQRSLAINSSDIRWWSLGVKDVNMAVEFTVRVDENYNNALSAIIYSQQPALESSAEEIISLKKRGPDAMILDAAGNVVAEVESGDKALVRCEFTRGSDTYKISVNYRTVSEASELHKKIYSVDLFQLCVYALDGQSAGGAAQEDSYVLLDNLCVYSSGKDTPQNYSTQETGSLPDIKLPEAAEEAVKVYVNDTKLKLEKAPFCKDGQPYIDAESLAKALGFEYAVTAEGGFEMKNGNALIKASADNAEIDVNGKTVTLVDGAAPVKTEDGGIAVTANFINEAFNAKVWWDEKDGIFAVTVGEYKDNGILVSLGGKLYMNGEPYYEISFNKFDLFYQIFAEYEYNTEFPDASVQYEAAEAAVKQLSEAGFSSIRAFMFSSYYTDLMYNEEHQKTYFEAMDRLFDLCDKYNMKIVVCMGLIEPHLLAQEYVEGEGWIATTETVHDMVANPESESRKNVYKYIEMFVERYKDRDTVLMWEIKNEGNLEMDIGEVACEPRYSLLQLANFYGDCAEKIRSVDGKRLVTSGDSILRPSQWNLFKSVMAGEQISWQTDTVEEHFKALAVLNEKLDVVSAHVYGLNCGNTDDFTYMDENGEVTVPADWDMFMEQAAAMGKAFYNGECNTAIAYDAENFEEETEKYLNAIIDAGVQLSHWWTFRSDRVGFNDGPTWQCNEGVQWELITAANKKLKETYMINGVTEHNTDTAWEEASFEVLDINSIQEEELVIETVPSETEAPAVTDVPATDNADNSEKKEGCGSVLASGFAVIAVCACGAAMAMRKKRSDI